LDGEPLPAPESDTVPEQVLFASEDDGEDRYCAWEDRENQGTVKAYIETASRCLVNPTHFFANLPLDAGYGNPLLFGVMSVVVGAVFTSIWYSILRGGLGSVGLFGLVFTISFTFVGALIVVPITILFWSLITHGLLALFGGAKSGFQATLRVISYSSVTSVFSAIPVVGTVASLWVFYLEIVGIRETHETSTSKAAAAVLVLPAVVIGIWLVFWAGAFFSGGGRMPAQDLCGTIEQFVGRVDAAVAAGQPAQAQTECSAALVELEQKLKGFKRDPRGDEVRKKAQSFAGTAFAIMAMRAKMGQVPGMAEMDATVDKLRAALREECLKAR
jgi:hypothetical protein